MTRHSARTTGRSSIVNGWLFVVAGAVLFVGYTTATRGPVSQVLVGVALLFWMLATVLAPVLWVVRRLTGRLRHGLTAAVRTWAVLFVVLVAYSAIVRTQSAATRARGDEIVEALERHRDRTGSFPSSLASIHGPDPAAVPRTSLGWIDPVPFRYERTNEGEPRLWYHAGFGVITDWMPRRGWRSED